MQFSPDIYQRWEASREPLISRLQYESVSALITRVHRIVRETHTPASTLTTDSRATHLFYPN